MLSLLISAVCHQVVCLLIKIRWSFSTDLCILYQKEPDRSKVKVRLSREADKWAVIVKPTIIPEVIIFAYDHHGAIGGCVVIYCAIQLPVSSSTLFTCIFNISTITIIVHRQVTNLNIRGTAQWSLRMRLRNFLGPISIVTIVITASSNWNYFPAQLSAHFSAIKW
jgi:hypothetical protein